MGNPTGIGGPVKGEVRNPDGVSKEQAAARDDVRRWLASDTTRQIGKLAYLGLLEEKNPLIVKDFMDRIAGKVKESVALEDGGGFLELVRAVLQLPREDRAKLARGEEDP